MWDDAFIGEIKLFAGNYAPSGYALCNGQLLPISQNTPLFALIGTTYGGNGVSNFALPDLRGRAAIGAGYGPGLTPYQLGDMVGAETASQNLTPVLSYVPGEPPPPPVAMGVTASQANPEASVPTVAPALALNYIICLNGLWPVRD